MKKPILSGLSVFILALTLTGCAIQIPKTIRGDGSELTTFNQVRSAPEATIGETVRWGGIIAEVRNRENSSEIEVVGFDLRHYGRPRSNDETYGRFRIVVSEFADPEVYAKGRMITVLGTYSGIEAGMIGEFNYQFPVVQAGGVELWREEAPRADDWRYDMYSPRYRNYLYGVGPYRVHPYHYPVYYYRQGGKSQGDRNEQSSPPVMERSRNTKPRTERDPAVEQRYPRVID